MVQISLESFGLQSSTYFVYKNIGLQVKWAIQIYSDGIVQVVH